MRWVLAAAALVLLADLIRWWAIQGPAIGPDDIQLDVVLRAPGMGENLQPFQDRRLWTLEIQLDKQTARPLHSDEWGHLVLPYADGFSVLVWDFFQGFTLGQRGGSPVGEEGYHIVQDSRFRPLAESGLRRSSRWSTDSARFSPPGCKRIAWSSSDRDL